FKSVEARIQSSARNDDALLRASLSSTSGGFLADNGIDRPPQRSSPVQHENSAVGACHESSIGSLLQRKHIPATQTRTLLQPMPPRIPRYEHSPQFPVVNYANNNRARIIPVREDRTDIAVRITMIGSGKGLSAIIAGHYSSTVGGQEHPVGIPRIDQDIINHGV